MRLFFFAATVLALSAGTAGAQDASAVYARAQSLVSEGQGAQGRALVDSVYRATVAGSAARAEALFWRATLAPTAADAERDYRAIVVDHATSPRVEDALLRLAQLELARGERDGALLHLRRIAAEYPASAHGARTSYWTARVLLEKGELSTGCTANAQALARVAAGDVELKNQIEYQQQRCRDVVVSAVAQPAAQPVAPPSSPRDATPSIPLDTARVSRPVTRARTYSVQVAATSTRAAAQSIVNRVRGRGYQGRIDGETAPFRVRIGRYDSAAAATRLLNELKSKGIDGFVATIEPR